MRWRFMSRLWRGSWRVRRRRWIISRGGRGVGRRRWTRWSEELAWGTKVAMEGRWRWVMVMGVEHCGALFPSPVLERFGRPCTHCCSLPLDLPAPRHYITPSIDRSSFAFRMVGYIRSVISILCSPLLCAVLDKALLTLYCAYCAYYTLDICNGYAVLRGPTMHTQKTG